MADPVSNSISAIGAVASLATKLLKSHVDEQSKRDLVDMVSLLLEAQTNTMAVKVENTTLLDANRELAAEIERMKDWAAEKQRYALGPIWENAVAYLLKENQAAGQPPHALCPNCFTQSKKTFLGPYRTTHGSRGGYDQGMSCPACQTRMNYPYMGDLPALGYAPD